MSKKSVHAVKFPRWHEDIMMEKRTLFHAPIREALWKVGDSLRLLATPNFPRCKIGCVTDVRQVQLLDALDADLVKLSTDRDDYLARWDALHPDAPSVGNPTVWRIEFQYGAWVTDPNGDPNDPPEWSLAG